MDVLAHLAGAFALIALLVHVATSLSASRRCRVPNHRFPAFTHGPSVTIIRPVCGMDAYEETTLRSTFELEYAGYELLFCCASAEDPVVALVQRLIAEYPSVQARLLIGEERASQNPKLNNVAKGWRAAPHEWIVIADSNVLMPSDYLQRLLAPGVPTPGSSARRPSAAGRTRLGRAGMRLPQHLSGALAVCGRQSRRGIRAGQDDALAPQRSRSGRRHLGACAPSPAEDAAATKVVRAAGLRVSLADGAFPQPLGFRSAPRSGLGKRGGHACGA